MTKVIHNPTLAEVIEQDDRNATFVIKPLYYGYGNTLGNSLRRVLLSSIKGAAIVAFKIEGVTHEFTAIDGIKEDAVEIMLRLKNVKIKSYSDEPVELRLEKKGAGVVTAGDIKTTADIEISNPDQEICTIDDPKKALVMDLVVDTGRGYYTIEQASEGRIHSDMIALDAMFSPVMRVRYKVENTRVGQDANLQQLELSIMTDGSMTPKEAFEEAAAILVNQYTALAGSTVVEAAPTPGIEVAGDDGGLMTPIEDLNLTARTANALVNNDIRTVRDLVTLSEQDLKELKGFGSKALDEVKEKLAELNI
ncbi:DNA-directed RNA polymerase subunit alpha [Candidatus Saccharibacteria bacterium]|nr:DNA-directed RNA polymerase subunit alpha [Candidatus Saccharibacteria bacterium]